MLANVPKLIALLAFGLGMACQADRPSDGRVATSLPAKSPDAGGGGRPADDGEGVPGYLADLDAVTIVTTGDSTEVQGRAGAVATEGGRGTLTVSVWRITTSDLQAFYAAPGEAWTVAGTLLTSAETSERGEFNASVPAPSATQAIIISTEPQSSSTRLSVSASSAEHVTTLVKDPGYPDSLIPILLREKGAKALLWTTEQMNRWMAQCSAGDTADFTPAQLQRLCACWGEAYSKRWTFAVTLFLSGDAQSAYVANDPVTRACEDAAIIRTP